jgi:hypothetical protein
MKAWEKMCTPISLAVILWSATSILVTMPARAFQVANGNAEAMPMVKNECAFSDGSTISFGHMAFGSHQSGDDVWRVGEYVAIAFHVSGRMLIPPLDRPIDIPAGTYTLFVDPSKGEPWTLIVSKKTGKPGMSYPGKRYDVGRTQMGFDDSDRSPVSKFIIGCTQHENAPIFISMASDVHVAYAKIEAVGIKNGKARYRMY